MGDSNPHFNFSPHLGDTLTCSPVCAGGATRTHIIPLPTQPKTPATDGRTRLERVEWHIGDSPQPKHTICVLYPYCITTWEICQEVFEISFKGLFLLGAPLTPGVLWTPLDFSYIVPHIGRFVKGFFTFFFEHRSGPASLQ